ncbi:MAG TPA: hypothetical protein H9848_12270 [Candidatus Parabacteroides intestinigallinarum]|uniref:DUF6383 domain-containing protein n=1 Tax=Candidatus Parabacteroides intestinigallinarum TaxID=2838722 RepID=A0A9D1XTA6_9BACT|nr:hypothetical protein [Candidatus Parabacteroides intestinigallinarum]
MNKKISTLFTAGLLVAGSLCGSAWAKDIVLPIGKDPIAGDKLSQGQEVFMSINDILYGFTDKDSEGKITEDVLSIYVDGRTQFNSVDEEELANWIWTVTWATGASETSYTLTNKATGDVLRINKNSKTVELNAKEEAKNTVSLFLFRDGNASVAYGMGTDGKAQKAPATGLLTAVISGIDYKLSWNADGMTSVTQTAATTDNLEFYAVETPGLTDYKELNALYNGSGFSFGVNTPDSKELIGNLFGDQKIVAVYLKSAITVDGSQNPTYADAKQLIPTGMYFFTENAPIKADGSAKTDYASWMNATVIAVSSTETVEATVADREEGQGYALTTMKIKDMNLYVEDTDPDKEWMSQGNEVSILNACFTVNKTYVGSYPYALTLNKFRYKAKDSEAAHTQKTVRLNVIGHSTNNYLATQVLDDPKFIFNLAASGMIDGIDLLNKEAKAAVYSIRVLGGVEQETNQKIDKEDVESAYGKYLTVAAKTIYYQDPNDPGELISETNFVFAAKAKVLAMENTPAYQWVITEVKDNDVTFTNRETDESFTAKLFPVEGQENVYELAVSRVNDDDAAAEADEVAATNVTPIYVNQNTYNETAGEVHAMLDKLVIELKAVEVDPYAGFLNVDDKTLVTMAFARDNNETSNKWYAVVSDSYQLTTGDREGNVFVNESSDAAQWQLIKSKSAKKIVERSFVYNDNGHVTVKAKADVAYAYQYKLQYITDGEETGYLLWNDNSFEDADSYGRNGNKYVDPYEYLKEAEDADDLYDFAKDADQKFIIKQNADGSIYLIPSTMSVAANVQTIFDENTKSVVAADAWSTNNNNRYYGQYDEPVSVYALPTELGHTAANQYPLHTYLIEEAPEVSYPAEEGYVYMKSEMGDYISMDANHDGIVVDENPFNLYLHVTDKDAVVPSFYISKGIEGSAERAYLFHPQDSVEYYAATGNYEREYEWSDGVTKAIFKVGTINATRDTIATMIKGEMKNVAVKADDEGTFGGLKNFKVQIVLADDSEDQYVVRSLSGATKNYLYAVNEKLTWTDEKEQAMKFTITEGDPTANEAIANEVEGVKVIAGNGTVEIQGAAGKNVVIANILGKVVASTTLTSDNQTINVPAGIVVVTVDGEAVKAVVR